MRAILRNRGRWKGMFYTKRLKWNLLLRFHDHTLFWRETLNFEASRRHPALLCFDSLTPLGGLSNNYFSYILLAFIFNVCPQTQIPWVSQGANWAGPCWSSRIGWVSVGSCTCVPCQGQCGEDLGMLKWQGQLPRTFISGIINRGSVHLELVSRVLPVCALSPLARAPNGTTSVCVSAGPFLLGLASKIPGCGWGCVWCWDSWINNLI